MKRWNSKLAWFCWFVGVLIAPLSLAAGTRSLQVDEPFAWWDPRTLIFTVTIGVGLLVVLHYVYLVAKHWRLRAVAQERAHLAHEIHDTLSQSFAGLGYQLQAIRNSIPPDSGALQQQVELAIELVRTSHEEARRSIASLRPETLGPVRLLAALQKCAQRMVRDGSVQVETQGEEPSLDIPAAIKETLFRIGQEAIANSVRHARPHIIRIRVERQPASICLSVEDDGAGFEMPGDGRGFGLRGMRNRAASIAATLEVRSAPGAGTRVQVTAPVKSRWEIVTWPGWLFSK